MEVERKRSARIALLVLETYTKMIKGSLSALNAMSPEQLKRLYLNGEKKLNKSLRLSTEEQKTLKNLSQTKGYETCDFSLLYKLIRHFDLLESPINGWGAKKVSGLNNIGDIIESLRKLRNGAIHRSNIAFEEHEANNIFHKSLNIARIADRILNRTTETFEEEVDSLRSWDPEQKLRDKYIEALEKITELRKLGSVRSSGYDIAIYMKNDLNSTPTDMNGRTPLTIYVKSDRMKNNEAVSQHLNEIKDKINNNAYNIVFDSAETGSVVIHITVKNSILLNETIMVQEMRDFVEKVFSYVDEAILQNFSHDIDCIFASSDTNFDEDDCEFDHYDENWLKLHIDVASSIQKDPIKMKNTLGQFVGDVFHATEGIHDSDTMIEAHIRSKGEDRYDSSGVNTRKRKGNFDCKLNENVKKWKHMREDTIPGLTQQEEYLEQAYNTLVKLKFGVVFAISMACGILLVAPFTSESSLWSALGFVSGACVSVILIEKYLRNNVLESVQRQVDNGELATSELRNSLNMHSEEDVTELISERQQIFHRKLRDKAPFFIVVLYELSVLNVLKKYITNTAESVLIAKANVEAIRKNLISELEKDDQLLEEFSEDDPTDDSVDCLH